jgi:molybdopterin converting factor small subunit
MSTKTATPPFAYRVLLFGPQAAACGKSQALFPADAPALSVSDLKIRLARAEPSLVSSICSARIAVNHAFVDETTLVRPEDEIALIGFVSGG